MMAEGGAQRAGRAIARVSAREERPERWLFAGFLNGGGLKVVELGEHQILQLWIAPREMDVERGPGFSQKYL